jgi:cytochrome b subunit of formate dehydrogenase
VVCYTTAWIALLAPFTINLAGLLINFFTGKWMINDLFTRLYYVLAAAIVIATILDFTPRTRRSTRGEGAEKAWFYVAVWMVVPTQLAGWAMWRLGRQFKLSGASLDHLRLATFLVVAGVFLILGLLGKLPRTQRYHIPEGVISDMPVSAGA